MALEALQSIGENNFRLGVFKDLNNYTITFVPSSVNMSDLVKKNGTDISETFLSMQDGEKKKLFIVGSDSYVELTRNGIETIGDKTYAKLDLAYYYANGNIISRLITDSGSNISWHLLGINYGGELFRYPIYLFIAINTETQLAYMRAIYMKSSVETSEGSYIQLVTANVLYNYLTAVPYNEYDPDAYGDLGYSSVGGGNGTFNFDSDSILPPLVPSFDIIDSGFIQIYKAEIPQIRALASYLWTDNFFDNIVKITQDPLDVIIGLNVYPFEISGQGQKNVQAGNVTTPVLMSVPDKQFYDIDCGSVEIKNFYGSYLDYSPYSKCDLFLPYSGVHEISLDDIMGKTVSIKYRVDLLTGACNIFIIVDNNVLYNFTGACSISVPITSRSYTEMYNSIMNIALGGAQMLSGGGVANFGSTIASGVMQSKPSFNRAGNCGGNIGFTGVQIPYFIFTIPRSAIPKNQNKFIGYPIMATYKLDDLSGFTVVKDIHFKPSDGMTKEEIAEIVSLLKGGVIL